LLQKRNPTPHPSTLTPLTLRNFEKNKAKAAAFPEELVQQNDNNCLFFERFVGGSFTLFVKLIRRFLNFYSKMSN
jgi:hypothetical protein